MKLLLLAGLAAGFCNAPQVPGTPPSPSGTTPVPTVTVPPPADAGAPSATCAAAYSRMWALRCPPAEDAHLGWVEFDCPKLPPARVALIVNAENCAETRAAQE